MVIGTLLLVVGLGLLVFGRQKTDGSSIFTLPDWAFSFYPALCVSFIAFGLALIVHGVL